MQHDTTAPYEIHAIDPDDNSTILEEHTTRNEAIRAWCRLNTEHRSTTTMSVEIWRDGQPVNER